jgi:hypothetical protein
MPNDADRFIEDLDIYIDGKMGTKSLVDNQGVKRYTTNNETTRHQLIDN